MKKLQTTYQLTNDIQLIKNEELGDHICLINFGETCSGILKYWGTKEKIIKDLENIIKKLKSFKN